MSRKGKMILEAQKKDDQFERSLSLSDIKTRVPRVNLKKIKLDKLQNIDFSLKVKNVTRFFLDDSLLNLDLPIKRTTEEKKYESISYNPLRKRTEPEDEEVKVIKEIKEVEEVEKVEAVQEKEEEAEKKDVTFNLEAQIMEDEENVIFSPATVSLPPFKADILSSSPEQSAFVWPPAEQKITDTQKRKETKKKQKKQKSQKKKKPYYLSIEKPPVQQPFSFPWTAQKENYQSFENIIQEGLESTLLDIPEVALPFVSEPPPPKETPLTPVIFKAIVPVIVTNEEEGTGSNKLNYGIELQGRIKKMFEKIGRVPKITPIRIIIFGGFVATLGYLIYGYFFGDLKLNYLGENKSDKVVVRDLFKQNYVNREDLSKSVLKETKKNVEKETESIFKPITENERLSLIQMAREALENRLDPFGQESVLPQSVIDKKIKEKEGEKPPPDIPFLRKQLELVGVISTKVNDLALVNIYTADYTVGPDDEDAIRETKLKSALTMAVPNRIEVSVLDPVEGWYVKQIQKSKSRNEDPYIELVKENKKFKLKVGQKVLLPEEKLQENSAESPQTE